MHELGVTQNILEIALRHAAGANASQVTELNLVIGQLASIVDDSVPFYWDIISKDTIAEGATLHFRRLPLELLCLDASKQYAPQGDGFACPQCQVEQFKVADRRRILSRFYSSRVIVLFIEV